MCSVSDTWQHSSGKRSSCWFFLVLADDLGETLTSALPRCCCVCRRPPLTVFVLNPSHSSDGVSGKAAFNVPESKEGVCRNSSYLCCTHRLLSGQSWLLLFLSQKGSGPVFVSSRVACRKILSKNVKIRPSALERFSLVVSQPKQGSKAFDSHGLHEFNWNSKQN